jgi:DNA-binding XRE family transcriptional regulator
MTADKESSRHSDGHSAVGASSKVAATNKTGLEQQSDATKGNDSHESGVIDEESQKSAKKSTTPQEDKKSAPKSKSDGSAQKRVPNNLRECRIEQMMSKAELARKAGLSVLTIDRIEKGYGCRMDTKRKILKALGLKLSDRLKVFKEE